MTNFQPPLPPELAACRGLSPSERADLIAGAKSRAMRFVWAVKGDHAAEVYRLTEDMGEAADDESTEGAA